MGSAPGDLEGGVANLMVRDGELLNAANRGRAFVVSISTVADKPAPRSFGACEEGGVAGVVGAVSVHIDRLGQGGRTGACGIARIVEIERDGAALAGL